LPTPAYAKTEALTVDGGIAEAMSCPVKFTIKVVADPLREPELITEFE
jgi:hypothetical protein